MAFVRFLFLKVERIPAAIGSENVMAYDVLCHTRDIAHQGHQKGHEYSWIETPADGVRQLRDWCPTV